MATPRDHHHVKTGYAVNNSRLSASGRYLFVIGRDARQTTIACGGEADNVANPRRLEALSVDTQVKGYEDTLRLPAPTAAPVRGHERRHPGAHQDHGQPAA